MQNKQLFFLGLRRDRASLPNEQKMGKYVARPRDRGAFWEDSWIHNIVSTCVKLFLNEPFLVSGQTKFGLFLCGFRG